jgi:hypothetical protein
MDYDLVLVKESLQIQTCSSDNPCPPGSACINGQCIYMY